MRITISGTAGSGKSTVAKMLADKLKYKHYSMGDLQREIAKQMGVSIMQLGEMEKKDSSIDKIIDKKQRELSRYEDNFVIDSWLGAYFVPNSFKIFMDADLKERAMRIMKKREAESYKNIDEAMSAIKQREKTNRDRWMKFYKYDFMNKSNYDMFLDTTGKHANDVLKQILDKLKEIEK
jgi:cytidylate kinase